MDGGRDTKQRASEVGGAELRGEGRSQRDLSRAARHAVVLVRQRESVPRRKRAVTEAAVRDSLEMAQTQGTGCAPASVACVQTQAGTYSAHTKVTVEWSGGHCAHVRAVHVAVRENNKDPLLPRKFHLLGPGDLRRPSRQALQLIDVDVTAGTRRWKSAAACGGARGGGSFHWERRCGRKCAKMVRTCISCMGGSPTARPWHTS